MKKFAFIMSILMVIGFAARVNADPLTIIGTAGYQGSTYNLIYEGPLAGTGRVWLDYVNGKTTWGNHVSWAAGLGANLTVTLAPGYTTTIDWTTGWRLPTTNIPMQWNDPLDSSELSHLYWKSLGNNGPSTTTPLKQSPFTALAKEQYWTGVTADLQPLGAIFVSFNTGGQLLGTKTPSKSLEERPDYYRYALAVIPGSVQFSTVPIVGYSVAFDLAGGVHTGGGSLLQTIERGQAATAPTATKTGAVFNGWNKTLTDITENQTITALWRYGLNVGIEGEGSVRKTPDLEHYIGGTSVTLTAVPSPGWGFAGWSNEFVNPIVIEMPPAEAITAFFLRIGDLNWNNVVNLADAVTVLRILTGLPVEEPIYMGAGIKSDGKVSLADAIYILQTVAEIR